MCGIFCCCCCAGNCCCLALFSTQAHYTESFRRLWVIVWVLTNIYCLFSYSSIGSYEENKIAQNINNEYKTNYGIDYQGLKWDTTGLDSYYHLAKSNLEQSEPKIGWIQTFKYISLFCITVYNIKGLLRLNGGQFMQKAEFDFHRNLTNFLTFLLFFQGNILATFNSFALFCIPLFSQVMFKHYDRYNTNDFVGSVFFWILLLFFNICYHLISTWGFVYFIFHSILLPMIEYPLVFMMAGWFYKTSEEIIKKLSNDTYLMHTRDKTKQQIIQYFFSDISQVFLLVLCFFCIHYSEIFIEYINGYKPALTSVIVNFTYSVPFALLLNYPKPVNPIRVRKIFFFNVISIMFSLQCFGLLLV